MGTTSSVSIETSFYSQERFDVLEVNGKKFALFKESINSNDDIFINLTHHHVIFLKPIEAKKNITVRATTVIALSKIKAREGETEICVSKQFICLEEHQENVEKKFFKDHVSIPIIKERLELILELLQTGISHKNSTLILSGLSEVYDAIIDPNLENKSFTNDIADAFEFFNIPLNQLTHLE